MREALVVRAFVESLLDVRLDQPRQIPQRVLAAEIDRRPREAR